MVFQAEKGENYLSYAENMVKAQIQSRGISNSRVLDVMRKLPRHLFIDTRNLVNAYGDHPVSIDNNQTISQPYIVAYMTDLLGLKGDERVLEIGTGSGYQTAVLGLLCKEVYSVERIQGLSYKAGKILKQLGFRNIQLRIGDGSLGWPEHSLYDRIIVTAAIPEVPYTLKDQLLPGGKAIMPVGDWRSYQNIVMITRERSGFRTDQGIGCRFVPLLGQHGFK